MSTTEKVIISSNDESITLTNQRIIQREKNVYKEITLDDFISYEIVRKKHPYYKILVVFFTCLILITYYVLMYVDKPPLQEVEMNNILNGFIYFFGLLLSIALLILLFSSDKYLRINGKFNSILISLKYLKKGNLDQFLRALTIQFENRKKTMS